MKNYEIILELACEIFEYNPETGIVINKIDRYKSNAKAGTIAGCINSGHGYIQLSIKRRIYTAHSIIWLMQTGKPVPIGFEIDHINRNKLDNRWSNFRLATKTQNKGNSKIPKHNTFGIKGVHWSKRAQMWRADIRMKGKSKTLGYFANIEDAAEAYKQAAFDYFKEFANPERKI